MGTVNPNTGHGQKPMQVREKDTNLNMAFRPKPHPYLNGPNHLNGMPSPRDCKPVVFPEQCRYLDRIADDVISQVQITPSELKEREDLRLALIEVCKQVVQEAAVELEISASSLCVSLVCFGSLRAGIALRGSDMDLLLRVTDENGRDFVWDLDIPRRLEKKLLVHGYGARLLTSTRVPVLKTCSEPGKELCDNLREELEWWMASQQKSLDPNIKVPSLRRPDGQLLKAFSSAIKDGKFNKTERNVIQHFRACYRKAGGNSKDPDLCAARLSLEKLPRILDDYPNPGPIRLSEFPTQGVGINCDIGFAGELARHNSQLIRCYGRCDERIRLMILFVKAWAKNRDINSAYKGMLCSYGYVLMVLHYALNIATPPLCPNLQHQLGALRGGAERVPKDCNGYNIQFWRDEKEVELAARRGMLTYNDQSLGTLLRGFFEYYSGGPSPKNFHWGWDVVSIRTKHGIVNKRAKGWTSFRKIVLPSASPDQPPRNVSSYYLVAIEDPFEIDHNVARTVTRTGSLAIKDEFARAHRIIERAGMLGGEKVDLMEVGTMKMGYLGNLPVLSGPNNSTVTSTNRPRNNAKP